jgi:hypothetical protein
MTTFFDEKAGIDALAGPPFRGENAVELLSIFPRNFAIISHIEGRLASSGAGSAAYRFCRLVNVPEYSNGVQFPA